MTGRSTEGDEKRIIEAAQKDPSQFAELYEIHFDRVYAFIVRRVRDREEAQDLTSAVFHQALANLGKFEWRGVPFAAWLMRIAANAVADHWKRTARSSAPSIPEEPARTGLEEEIERRVRISQLVRDLPEDQRRVIEQRFVEQKSIREIAEELRRSEGAVKQLQFRALQNLRARVSDENG